MKPSKAVAMEHFKKVVIPRRVRDIEAEEKVFEETDRRVRRYRRLLPYEEEEVEAEYFPVYKAGLKTLAFFGIGIGIYFSQLLMLAVIFLIGGFILIPAMNAYSSDEYGIPETNPNFLLTISAACSSPTTVSATVGCPSGASSCLVRYRNDCELPHNAVLADIAMCVFILAAVLLMKIIESAIEEELDESLQTAQDYSLVVQDPEPDADNPDEWFQFFSRFGKVRYVTITRRNKTLCALVSNLHQTNRKLREIAAYSKIAAEKKKKVPRKIRENEKLFLKEYETLQQKLDEAVLGTYTVCKVYVTFDTEDHKRLCHNELEVPDIRAILDIKKDVRARALFRGVNVLDVGEPPEPDNILWENVEMNGRETQARRLLMFTTSGAIIVFICFALLEVRRASPIVFSIVIGVVDSMLPVAFVMLTDLSAPHSEGKRLNTLQVQLFGARLLLSTFFPYYLTLVDSRGDFLDSSVLFQTMTVQFTTCFVSPMVNLLDLPGLVKRHLVAPIKSSTQAQLNSQYSGSDWSLAERYTVLAKIIFISTFYALLTPFSLIIGMIAFILLFWIDRFLLLRRWKPTAMLDAAIAGRLRQQLVLAIAVHMYVSQRFIYSWPMDQAYLSDRETNTFTRVDKTPALGQFWLTEQSWHTLDQRTSVQQYRIVFYFVALMAFVLWIVIPVVRFFLKLLCFETGEVGQSQGIHFNDVPKIPAYVPITTTKDNEKFIVSYTPDMLLRNRPSLLRSTPEEKDDLTFYVPSEHQPYVLSIVKYYGDDIVTESAVPAASLLSAMGNTSNGSTAGAVEGKLDEGDIELGLVEGRSRKRSGLRKGGGSGSDDAADHLAPLDEEQRSRGLQYKLVTKEDGTLERVSLGVPEDLHRIIQGKKVKKSARPRTQEQEDDDNSPPRRGRHSLMRTNTFEADGDERELDVRLKANASFSRRASNRIEESKSFKAPKNSRKADSGRLSKTAPTPLAIPGFGKSSIFNRSGDSTQQEEGGVKSDFGRSRNMRKGVLMSAAAGAAAGMAMGNLDVVSNMGEVVGGQVAGRPVKNAQKTAENYGLDEDMANTTAAFLLGGALATALGDSSVMESMNDALSGGVAGQLTDLQQQIRTAK